jgi:hypothetical protein
LAIETSRKDSRNAPGARAGELRRIDYVAGRLRVQRVTAAFLAAAIALVGGASMASMLGARRAAHALSEYIAWTRPEDVNVYADPSAPPHDQDVALEKAARLPSDAVTQRVGIYVGSIQPAPARPRVPLLVYVGIDPIGSPKMRRLRILHGRLPANDRADEVAVNEEFASRLHKGVGDHVGFSVYPPGTIDQLGNGKVPAKATGRITLTIAGIVREPGDLEVRPDAQPGTLFELNGSNVYGTPALWRRYRHTVAGYGVGVRVITKHHDAGPLAKEAQAAKVPIYVQPTTDVVRDPTSLQRSVRAESGALWALGWLILVVGGVLVLPALRRTVSVPADDRLVLAAMGSTRGELVAVEARRALPIVVVGALAAVPVALAMTPAASFGISALATLHPGVVVRPLFLAAGAVTIMVASMAVVVAAGLWGRAARKGARRARVRTGRGVLSRASATGAPPPVAAGVWMAVPASSRDGDAIRTAIAAVAAGLALLAAALTFSSSMHHLVATPALRGWTWDVEAGNFSQPGPAIAAGRALAKNRAVDDFTGTDSQQGSSPAGSINIVGFQDLAVARLPVMSGRLPSRPGEVAVAPHTLQVLHKHLGDSVALTVDHRRSFRIVGTTVGPGVVAPDTQLADGAIMSMQDLGGLAVPAKYPENYIIRFKPGVSHQQGVASLRSTFHTAILGPYATTEISTIEHIEPVPLWFAALVAVLAFGALIHAVASAMRLHRRDVALLRAVGFRPGQVRIAMLCQAAFLVVVAGIVGIPIGVIVGRWSWRVAVDGIGALVVPVVPIATVAGLVAASLLAAIAVGLVAALAVRRTSIAAVLRTE